MAAIFEGDPPPEFEDWVGSVEVSVIVPETQTVESAGVRSVVVGGEDIVGGAGTKDLGVQSGGVAKGKSPG